MREIDTVTASLNDDEALDKKEIRALLLQLFTEKSPDEISRDVLTDYLKIKKIEGGADSQIASSALNNLSSVDLDFYSEYLQELKSEDIQFAPFYSEEYPDRLWSIPDPPLCLYVDGDPSCISEGVTVVGTRSAKEHRLKFVREISRTLVELDKTVVSGLAKGVDAAAHRGALDADGDTVAVLPGEVRKVVPAGNRELGEEIRETGALISETTSKVDIHRGRFVERNRITSGISTAVIIGASGETGGTIHQANYAQEQNKPRFLYDPDVDDGQSPDKVVNKGFQRFRTLEELRDLLTSEFEPAEPSSQNASLNDY